jgi:hypothetical protein
MKMNRRRALINFTLTLGLLLGLGLIGQLDLPGWRAQASHEALGKQAAGQSAATGAAVHKLLKARGASAAGQPGLEPVGYAAQAAAPEISLEQPAGTPLVTGQVVAWGYNGQGQTSVPSGLGGVKAIASGGWHMAALRSNDTVVTWGTNWDMPNGLTNVVAIDAGRGHTVALKSDGTVVAWGLNDWGQATVPAGLTGVRAIAASNNGASALKSDGTIVRWGHNLGTPPAGLTNVVDIDCGFTHTLALKGDGTVVAWGENFSGEANVPPGLTGVVAIAAGGKGSFAVKSDGTVVAWGLVGSVPAGLTGVVAVAPGWSHRLALKNDGTVVAWGDNTHGQTNVPAGLTGVRAISANTRYPYPAEGHSAALTDSVVDFGIQLVGTASAAKTFTIKNPGLAPLTISNVSVNGGSAADFTVNTAGMLTIVPPLSQTTFTVRFAPNSGGAKHTTLRVLNNDSDEGSFFVHLSGVSVLRNPEISVYNGVDPIPYNELRNNSNIYFFDDTPVGTTSAARTYTIKNTGYANLTGLAVTMAGTNPGDFVLSALGATTLAPNATTTFTVRFKPIATGERNAVVRIASNDADENPFGFEVSGIGVNSAPTITPSNLTRQQGNPSTNVQIATVMDAQDAEQNLAVTVNGAAGATVNGVSINNLTVNTAGQVRANLAASCTATNASFTLTVTDSAGATANATLNVTVTANAAPTVGNYSNTLVAPGGTTTVTPSAAPADNGSIASIRATATPNFFTGTLTANTATGALTISNANPVGGYNITVTVKDNCGATTTRSFMLTVSTCGASLSKTGQNFAANGGAGNFTVTIDGACTWTAVSNAPSFITIVSPQGQQAGTGTVSFSVAGHNTTTPRSGTITVAGQTFTVRQGAQFLDVPVGAPFYEEIGKLSAAGVTQGCGGGNYCPDPAVTREQMAVFLIRALGDFNPPAPGSQRFGDVPSTNPFYAFIEQMAVRGITSGCGGGNYCPTANVTREQMAAFIIRALHDPGYVPPAPGSQRFADVLSSNPFYGHIEEMAVRAITLGCGGGNYCPTANVTRGQMAAFLVRAFGL